MASDAGIVVLEEHKDSEPIALSLAERDALRELVPRISMTPIEGHTDLFTANPGNTVGAVQLGERRFELRPKIAVRRLLFLLSYSLDPRRWRRLGFDFEERADLFEAVVPGFAFQVEEALRQGPLYGYREEEGSLRTVRGQIQFGDQIRSRFGLVPPVECRFDEFTDDVEVNRLLKAAIRRLGAIRMRSAESRARLRALGPLFDNVSAVAYDPRRVPEIRYDRLNERFRRPVELARLILRTRSLDARSGEVGGAAFLVDLAQVFEDFVSVALRETLGLGRREFPSHAAGKQLFLDEDRRLGLRPDLSWWRGGRCLFVGDVKYKRTPAVGGVRHPDAYQLLAYTTATELPRGLLLYAAGEEAGLYRIGAAGKEIEVRTLDLDAEPEAVLDQVRDVADLIRSQAQFAAA